MGTCLYFFGDKDNAEWVLQKSGTNETEEGEVRWNIMLKGFNSFILDHKQRTFQLFFILSKYSIEYHL